MVTRPGAEPVRLPSKCTDVRINRGDIITVHTPGAGGYGNPLCRQPEAIRRDIFEGRVTEEKAAELYGYTNHES